VVKENGELSRRARLDGLAYTHLRAIHCLLREGEPCRESGNDGLKQDKIYVEGFKMREKFENLQFCKDIIWNNRKIVKLTNLQIDVISSFSIVFELNPQYPDLHRPRYLDVLQWREDNYHLPQNDLCTPFDLHRNIRIPADENSARIQRYRFHPTVNFGPVSVDNLITIDICKWSAPRQRSGVESHHNLEKD